MSSNPMKRRPRGPGITYGPLVKRLARADGITEADAARQLFTGIINGDPMPRLDPVDDIDDTAELEDVDDHVPIDMALEELDGLAEHADSNRDRWHDGTPIFFTLAGLAQLPTNAARGVAVYLAYQLLTADLYRVDVDHLARTIGYSQRTIRLALNDQLDAGIFDRLDDGLITAGRDLRQRIDALREAISAQIKEGDPAPSPAMRAVADAIATYAIEAGVTLDVAHKVITASLDHHLDRVAGRDQNGHFVLSTDTR